MLQYGLPYDMFGGINLFDGTDAAAEADDTHGPADCSE